MSSIQLFFLLFFDADPSQMCRLVLLPPVQLSDNKQLVCKKTNKHSAQIWKKKYVSFPDTQRPSLVLALAAVGEHHRSFSVMRPEFIPQGSVSGLGDKFFSFFPSSAGHLPKRLVGGFLSAWIKLGKSLLAYEYITQRGTEKVFEEDGIQREKGGKKSLSLPLGITCIIKGYLRDSWSYVGLDLVLADIGLSKCLRWCWVEAVGTALGVEGQTQCSLALKASLVSAAQSTLCFLRRPPCGQRRRGGMGGGHRTKPPQFFKKALIAKKISSFSLEFQVRNAAVPFFCFSIPPVVSDSFITSQRQAAPDKGISTTPPPRKRVSQLKGGRSLAAGHNTPP